jgi:replicative DNA helicase
MDRLELAILKNLIYNDEYSKRVLPFIHEDYFSDNTERLIFKEVKSFINKYETLPTHEALVINITESPNLIEEDVRDSLTVLRELEKNKNEPTDKAWLTEQSEFFCQDRAIHNAIMESVQILDGRTSKKAKGEIPKLLSDALAVSFDSNVGHDYITDYSARYEFYHKVESRVKFDLDLFNKITKGGLPNKTLNILLAGTGVGKSMFMCHMSAACISQGLNVLYITMEMAEERIAERIDANLLNISLNDIEKISKQEFESRFKKLQSKTNGKLIIKEYPTASASVLHFRALMTELRMKKSFKPDIVFIDYLNICSSSRVKQGGSINSYTYIKNIAEELRGFAVEHDVPVFSATQTTRSGFTNSDIGLEDTSESFGLPATADFMFALISTEELEQLNQIMVKQLKNRYNDPSYYKKFVVGVDRSKMRLYDAEQSAQEDIIDSGQDKPLNSFGSREGKFKGFSGDIKI